jgi:hypothetical protein
MWFVLAGLLLARKAFSTYAQVAYTVHLVFNIKPVCLHYVILEMHSFPMSAAKHFYDNPLSIYLDPKSVLIIVRTLYIIKMRRGQSSESIPGLIKRLHIWALVAKGHKNTNVPLILKIWDINFFGFGQTT